MNLFKSWRRKKEPKLTNDLTWHTADGRFVEVRDMTSAHLINAIAHVRKRSARDKDVLELLEHEAAERKKLGKIVITEKGYYGVPPMEEDTWIPEPVAYEDTF